MGGRGGSARYAQLQAIVQLLSQALATCFRDIMPGRCAQRLGQGSHPAGKERLALLAAGQAGNACSACMHLQPSWVVQ